MEPEIISPTPQPGAAPPTPPIPTPSEPLPETSLAPPEPVEPPAPAVAPVAPLEPVADNPTPSQPKPDNLKPPVILGDYVSNPILNSVRGLILILKNNPVPALISGVWLFLLYIVFVFGIGIAGVKSPALAIVVGIVGAVLGLGILNSLYVIGSKSAREEVVSFGDAFKLGLKKVPHVIVLAIVLEVLLTVGLILLVIPGLIIMARGSLSLLVLFEEDLGPIKAIKRSFALTKGHVIEMLGSAFAGMLLAGPSLLFGAAAVAPSVGRYHDLRALQESGAEKPKVHWMNYLALILVVLYFAGTGALLAFSTFHGIQNKAAQSTYSTPGSSFNSTDFNATSGTPSAPAQP